jgi:hypothetical protein
MGVEKRNVRSLASQRRCARVCWIVDRSSGRRLFLGCIDADESSGDIRSE